MDMVYVLSNPEFTCSLKQHPCETQLQLHCQQGGSGGAKRRKEKDKTQKKKYKNGKKLTKKQLFSNEMNITPLA